MNNPLVSIIIPCFNVSDFIEDCIKSALNQSYGHIELICIDNGSTDGTLEILKRYEAEGKVQLLIQPIKGAPAARNMGWKASQGEWIQFLDADDLLEPNKISHQIKLVMHSPDTALVVGDYLKVDLDTGVEIEFKADQEVWKGLLQNGLGITSANLFRKDLVQKVNGFDTTLRSSQEYDLMLRILQLNDRVVFNSAFSTKVQTRSSSISKTDIEGNKHRFLVLVARICEFMKVSKSTEYKALDQSFFNAMYNRIRLNSVHGYPDSAKFYSMILPDGFKPAERPYDGMIFKTMMSLLGFKSTDALMRSWKKLNT